MPNHFLRCRLIFLFRLDPFGSDESAVRAATLADGVVAMAGVVEVVVAAEVVAAEVEALSTVADRFR